MVSSRSQLPPPPNGRSGSHPAHEAPAAEESPASQAVERLVQYGQVWGAHAARYVGLRADGVAVQVRTALLQAALLFAAGCGLAAAAVTAVVLLLAGLVHVLQTTLEWPAWAAELTVGGSVLLLLGLAMYLGVQFVKARWLAALEQKYASRPATAATPPATSAEISIHD